MREVKGVGRALSKIR